MNKKEIYFSGDMIGNNGPANVNKEYYRYLKNNTYFCFSNNKIVRLLNFVCNIGNVKYVLISGFSKFNLLIIYIAHILNKKVSYLMHGSVKLESNYANNINNQKVLIEKKMLYGVDKIICISDILKQYVVSQYKELESKIAIVNNGINVNSSIDENNKLKLTDEIFKIVSIGGGNTQKNNIVVCKAIKYLIEKYNYNIKYIVIGAIGQTGEQIRNNNFVEYYEYISNEKVHKILSESNLYIQNSYFDTFPLSILEAIYEGCEILISKNCGCKSAILNIDSNDIIYNCDDLDEILKKIMNKMNNKNNKIYKLDNISWENQSKKLIKEITHYE